MQIRDLNFNNQNKIRQLKIKIENIYRNPYSLTKKHNTLRRLLNLIIITIQKILRVSYVFGYPYYVVIEPTNICNLKCPLCPTGQGIGGRPKAKLSYANFKKIIDDLGPYLYSLRLENWGEPLLNEEIFDMISYAKSKKIATSFNTNFTFLDEHSAERLILSGVGHIKISLDGTSGESYAKYRVGGDFNKVVNNIKLLVKKRTDLNKTNPFIEIQFIVMKHNEDQITEMQRLCLDLGVDGLFLERARPDMREDIFNSDSVNIEKFKEWLPQDTKYSIFDYRTKRRKDRPRICGWLWTSTVINCDGTIVPCCGIYDECYDFGNIFKDGFSKVWNSQKYISSRKLMGHKIKSAVETVCINCFRNGVIT